MNGKTEVTIHLTQPEDFVRYYKTWPPGSYELRVVNHQDKTIERIGKVIAMMVDTGPKGECVKAVYIDESSTHKRTPSLRFYRRGQYWETETGGRRLAMFAAAPMVKTAAEVVGTPKAPEPPKKEQELRKEFSEKGVMPSDHPGINEMLKKGFKEIFGGDLQQTKRPPSYPGLTRMADEKYRGLGFNDGCE